MIGTRLLQLAKRKYIQYWHEWGPTFDCKTTELKTLEKPPGNEIIDKKIVYHWSRFQPRVFVNKR